ncbi:MAG: GNAT family N-acetyltransferase [Streptomyces sp.]
MTTDLVIRALGESEARSVFTSLPDPGLVGRPLLGRPYATLGEGGEYRPEWTWVALRDGQVVARAAFWAGPEDEKPVILDWFDFAPGEREAGVRLLRETPLRAEFELVLPPDWRTNAAVRAAAEARIDAAATAGYRPLVERFRYLWTTECGVPEHPHRLVFRPEPDDEVFLDVLRDLQHGTLDAHARQAVAAAGSTDEGIERAAREDLEHFRWLASPREWWRLAHTPDGALVGLHVPGRIPSGSAVGFVGVVPGQRGNGYAYDLLAACTRQLVDEGAQSIAASTDLGNAPMAAAFAKAGYPIVQHRYCMTPEPGTPG